MTSLEASKLVKGFEDGTYPASQWSHYDHFVMALWYTYYKPLPEARVLIKEGIKKYNEMNGGENTDNAGYHETITEFYIRIIIQYQLLHVNGSDIELLLKELDNQDFVKKDFPFEFYRKETLMSKTARKEWVKPDLKSDMVYF